MWNWIKWLIPYPVEDNKLEEDDRILEELRRELKSKITEKEKGKGVVTKVEYGFIEISRTWVASEKSLTLNLGSLVSFTKPLNPESNVVTEVELLQNVTQQNNWENKDSYEGVISIIDEEKLLLDPGSLLVWRNDADITFKPESGDLVIVEYDDGLLKLKPKECKIITDKVIKWDGKQGFLDNKAKISLDICDEFYVPKVGDMVISCTISCINQSYNWRSLNVIKVDSIDEKSRKIEVTNVPVFIVTIGEEKLIELFVKNIYCETLEVKSVHISPETPSVTLIENPVKFIEPAISAKYRFTCKGKSLGWTFFVVEFKFKGFTYNKSVKYFTSESCDDENVSLNRVKFNGSLNFVSTQSKPNFLRVKPQSYEIPKDLIDICKNRSWDRLDCMSWIQQKIPEFYHGLTMKTYSIFFHTLLYLEEIANNEIVEGLETVAPLIRAGEYYVIKLESGADYSKVVVGDNVFISNPWVEDGVELSTQLRIHHKKDNEIYLKLKDVFNTISDRGTLFRMKFKSGRTCIIRTHHALDYFIGQIGVNWLFPDITQKNLYAHNRPQGHKPANLSKFSNYFFKDIDTEQRDAVNNIVFTYDNLAYPYILYGPPGTGKTRTLVEATLQVLRRSPRCRILFAAPSNSAVDTYCELLLLKSTLSDKELIRATSLNYTLHGQLPVNLTEYSAVLNCTYEAQHDLRACDPDELRNYRVVAGTLSTLGIINCIGLRKGHFTHIFVDEAGQTTEPETLIPLACMKPGHTRVVLAGDPSQLGPVIISKIAKAYQFGDSLMRRLMAYPLFSRCLESDDNSSIKPAVATMLRKNYRSLPEIVELTSHLFYNDRLQTILGEGSREDEILRSLKETTIGRSGSSLIVATVNGHEETQLHEHEGHSYYNSMEAARVGLISLELYKIGLNSQQIGVITPYSMQVKYIRECFKSLSIEPPKIGTAEEFQGSERDIIIISLVRSNLNKPLPFINEPRRANVSLSRAKVMNIVVANTSVLSRSELWKQVLLKSVCTK